MRILRTATIAALVHLALYLALSPAPSSSDVVFDTPDPGTRVVTPPATAPTSMGGGRIVPVGEPTKVAVSKERDLGTLSRERLDGLISTAIIDDARQETRLCPSCHQVTVQLLIVYGGGGPDEWVCAKCAKVHVR